MIEFDKLESIKMSLMKLNGSIGKDGKTGYTKFNTATFNLSRFLENIEDKEAHISGLLHAMYSDLVKHMNNSEDSLGMWIEYNGKEYENAILLKTLKDMEDYGVGDTDALYEFYKLTLSEFEDSPIIGDVQIETVA